MNTRYGAPVSGNEKEVLAGYLDHYRQVKHLAYVERGWFQEGIAGGGAVYPFDDDDPEADFRIEPEETTKEILELYRAECANSRTILEAASLDALSPHPQRSADYNVRWIVVHMLEETARHAGHADIIREMIDGKTETGYV